MAITAPIITITERETDSPVTQWDSGIIKQNEESNVLHLRIWNNKGGETAVSHLKEVTITTLDTDGGANSPVIINRWVQVKLAEETEFVAIGGTTTKSLKALGVNEVDGFEILGTANDGTSDSTTNYCDIDLKIVVPINAAGGIYDFKTRISGYYT